MDVIASEPQNGDDNVNNPAQIFPCEDECKALTSHVTDSDYEVSKNADECNQARNEILITSAAATSPEADSPKLNKISPHDLHPISNQKTDVISENVVPGSRSKRASRLPISSGRNIISTTTAHNAAWLDKRKFRAVSSSGGSEQSAHPAAHTSRPKSSRFPKVSVRPRASTVGSAGGGPTVGPLPTTLPPIVTPDRVAGVGHWGRSRIPVRARSVDCRPERPTSRQSGRLSTRSSSCGSDGTRQAARRSRQSSAHSGSCSPDSVHQAARRSVMRSARSSSYDSETRQQTARRSGLPATRPSSCGSADGRQRVPRPPETASNWSLIDVNDNNRLLFGGQTTAVLDHEYDAKRKTDLIVIEHKQHDQEDPPSLPRVLRLKQHWENESGSSSARDGGAFPTGPRQGAAASFAPASPGCSAAASGVHRRPGDVKAAGPARSAARSGPSGQRSGPSGQHAGRRTPGVSHTPPREPAAGRTPGSAAPGSAGPGATPASQKTPGASRRPPVTYRPNLTPYPRQYILLGLLGPDPDQVKHRQDKMKRQREYVERQSHQNRVAARRLEVVPVRVCSAEPGRRGQSASPRRREQSASPRRREQSASPRRRDWSASPQRQERQPLQTTTAGSASEERVMGTDFDFMHPVPVCHPNQTTTTADERSASSPDHQLTSAKDDGETHPENAPDTTERDNIGQAPEQSGVKVSSSTSVSECASEYSLDWGREEIQLLRRESSVLSLDGGELMEVEMTAIHSKIMTGFDSVEEPAAVMAQEPAVEESAACKEQGPEEEKHVAEKPEQEEEEEMQGSDEGTTLDTVKSDTIPLESKETAVKEEIPSCEISLEHHYQETLQNETETHEVVIIDSVDTSATSLEIESNTPEPMSTVSLISESVSVKSEQTEEWPDWIRTCDQVNESWLEVAEDLAINELLNGLPQASGDTDSTPTSHQSHEYSSASPDQASESESENDEFLSEAKSDITSDSDTEMVDALEELPSTPLRPELTDTLPLAVDLPPPSPLTPSPPPPSTEQASTTSPPTPSPPTDIYPSSQVTSLPPTLSPPLALQTPSSPIPVPLPESRLVPLSVGLLYGDGFRWEGGAGGGCVGQSARRCSSDDLFLELPEQMAVSVTTGQCRGASGGCSCGPSPRPPHRTPAVDRSTQAPRQPASFVYKNLLVMDLTEDAASERSEGSGEAVSGAGAASMTESGTTEAGAELAAESGPALTSVPVPVQRPVPVQGPFRRRRWDSRLWPSMLPDQPALHRSWEETNWPDID